MSDSHVLIGVCRVIPEVLSFVTPIFRDGRGAPVAQIVKDGRVASFEELDLGEQFVPLAACVRVKVGDAALYAMEFEDGITLVAANDASMPRAPGLRERDHSNAIRRAFEMHRNDRSGGFLSFPLPKDACVGRGEKDRASGHREMRDVPAAGPTQQARLTRASLLHEVTHERVDSQVALDLEHELREGSEHRREEVPREPNRALIAQAAHWYLRCRSEALPQADCRRLWAWLRRSREHVKYFMEMVQIDELLRQRTPTSCSSPPSPARLPSAKHLRRQRAARTAYGGVEYAATDERECDEKRPRRRRVHWALWAASAAILLASVNATVGSLTNILTREVIATRASEWDRQLLDDGTIVYVDARSALTIDFRPEARTVHLDKGSVVFDVAKDAGRPFTVRTNLVDVTAVGTKFGVSLDDGVTTTVSEGTVQVSIHGGSITRTVMAGQELRVPNSPRIEPLDAKAVEVDAARRLEWIDGMLTLEGLTVAQGVEQFNRRNRVQILVNSTALAAKVVPYARVRIDSPQTYAGIVAQAPGVTLTIDDNHGVIWLSEAADESSR